MANILKFFRRIHHATPAFTKEDLNDDQDIYSNGKVLQNNLSRQNSADTNSQTHTDGDKKVKFKKRKNLFDPPNNNSPISDNEFNNSFRAKLFVSPNINRFKRFHSLNNENVERCQSETVSTDNKIPDNFVFERVKVKKNTRYLRHSPDRSSFESMSPTVTPNHLWKNQQLRATASIDGVSKVTQKTIKSNYISFNLKNTDCATKNEIYALEWSDNNSSALHLWDDNKNSLEDINNNNWDDGFEIHMHHSRVSPMLSSISSSSTMDTWVDDEISCSKSLDSSDWNDVTHGVN